MILCPSYCCQCRKPTIESDYYWHKKIPGFVPQRRYKQCKACVLAQRKKELQEKNEYNKQFFI